MTETQYILQLTLVGLVSGAAFWVVASWAEKRKLQPIIDEERKLRSQLEVKRQEEAQKAEEQHEVLKTQLAAASTRCATLETALNTEKDATVALQSSLMQTQQTLRDTEAQMAVMRARQSDLEGSLLAEKGRLGAMQAALDAKQELAQQLAQELNATRLSITDERNAAAQREGALRASLAEYEHHAARGLSTTEGVQGELDSARAALSSLEREAEAKQTEIKRKLAAAEQRAQMLQKEVMALVSTGNPAEAAAVVTAAEDIEKAQARAITAEKRVTELEAQLAQGDTGTRKRLREAEYKICELEFKLAQTVEASPHASTAPAVSPATQSLPAAEPRSATQPLVALTETHNAPSTEPSVQPTSGL